MTPLGGSGRARLILGMLLAALLALGFAQPAQAASGVVTGAKALPALVAPPKFGFQPVGPVRLLDTRNTGGPIGAGQTRQLNVLALGIPTTGVGSVALNITTTDGTAPSFVTVWPTGTNRPPTSTVNFGANTVVPNTIVVGVGTAGQISIFNSSGSVHVIADATGWFPTGSGVTPIPPNRLLDTRGGPTVGAGGTRNVQVAGGNSGVPVNAIAVTANVTATEPTQTSHVSVYPAGQPRPMTSSLNFGAGATVANALFATVGSGGEITLFNLLGSVHLIVDITGYLSPTSGYVALPVPVRVADTRDSGYQRWGTWYSPGNGQYRQVGMASSQFTVLQGLSGTNPVVPVGPAAAVLNVTATDANAPAPLQLWPEGAPRPSTSTLNATPAGPVANGSIMQTPDGYLEAATFVPNTYMHVIIDVTGYFPHDGVGLVHVMNNVKKMSLGVDRIGVVFCLQPGNTINRAQVVANLNAQVAPFFKTISRDRYNQVFTDSGRTANLAAGDTDCLGKLATVVPASAGFNAALGIKAWETAPNTANGLAGPGNGQGTTFPANMRDGQVSASSVFAYGPPALPFYNVTAHELGHMLDWTHSHLAGAGAYTNPFDLMSGRPLNKSTAATYLPINTIAVNRLRAGWIDPKQVRIHAGGTVTYTIAPPGAAGLQLVAVRSGPALGGVSRFLTLDVRVKTGPDAALDVEGVEVMMVQDTLAENGILGKVAPAWGAANTTQHVLTAGTSKTLTSAKGNVTISVGAKAADGSFPVTVTGSVYDPGVMASSIDLTTPDPGTAVPTTPMGPGPRPDVQLEERTRSLR